MVSYEGYDDVKYAMIIANISLKLEKYNYNGPEEKFRNFSVGLMLDSEVIDKKI
jgi:hypothetical protein